MSLFCPSFFALHSHLVLSVYFFGTDECHLIFLYHCKMLEARLTYEPGFCIQCMPVLSGQNMLL